MKNVFAAVFIAFVLLAVLFASIGGSFDRQFWLALLPGLMGNLVVLTMAVFIIDGIFRHGRLEKLKETNESQARFVLFLSNRMAYLILQHFALVTKEEASNDAEMNFGFARNKLKSVNLAEVFYEKVMETKDKEIFADEFTKTLYRQHKGISKALDAVYPRPDPALKQIVEKLLYSIGAVDALKMFFRAFKAANEQVPADQQLKPEHLDVLIKVTYDGIAPELENIQRSVLQLSESAEANQLFIRVE